MPPSPDPTQTPAPAASPTPTPSPRPAIIKLRVEYEANSIKQPIGLKRFFLLRDDYEKLPATLTASIGAPSRSAYYTGVGASQELLAWFAANNCDYVYCREMKQTDLQVPEFRQAYERGLRKWRDPEIALRWLTVNLPEPIRVGYYRQRTPTVETLAARSRVVAEVVTSEKGIALMTNIPPGEYYVSSILPIETGGACVLWHHKVTIPPGKTGKDTTLNLDNSNAKPRDCRIVAQQQRVEQTTTQTPSPAPSPPAKP